MRACTRILCFLFLFLNVATITKRLVLGFPAPAKSDTISNFVLFAVCGFYRDSAAYPERTVFVARIRLNHNN